MPTPVPVTSPKVIVRPMVQIRFCDNFQPWKQANSRINFTQVTSSRYYGKNKASYHDKYTKRSFRWCKYCRLALYHSRSPQYRTKAGGTKPQLWSNYETLKDLPYLTLTGESWGVFSGLFGENRSRNMVRAMVHYVTISHKPFGLKQASEVYASVVTESPPACLHKLRPRGHQSGNWRKPQMKDVSNLINICPTNPIQVLNLHGIFSRLCLCPANNIFDINIKKNRCCYLGPKAKTGIILEIRQT